MRTSDRASSLDREFLSVREFATACGIGLRTAYREVAAGRIPSIRVGKRQIIP